MNIVDFYAEWCGPCKLMQPILEEIEKEFDIKIKRINVDESQEETLKNGVMSIPTMIISDGDKEIHRFVGFTPKDKIAEVISSARIIQG